MYPWLGCDIADLEQQGAILVVGSIFQPVLGKHSDTRGRKPLMLLMLFGAGFFALFAGLSDNLYWAIIGLLPAVAMLTAVRPVILAAAVEHSGQSEATTLGIVFTILDGVGMFGALLGGLAGEFDLSYAFIMASGMALCAGLLCIFLNLKVTDLSRDQPVIAEVGNPADP